MGSPPACSRLAEPRPSPRREDEACRLQGIVPRCVRHDEGEPRLHQHRQLAREREHPGVGRQESVPFAFVVVQREEDLPVVEIGEARVDVGERNELGFRHELAERRDDRVREVLVEGEQPPRHGGVPYATARRLPWSSRSRSSASAIAFRGAIG